MGGWVGLGQNPSAARLTSTTGLLVDAGQLVLSLRRPCPVPAQAASCMQGSMNLAAGWPYTMRAATGSRISLRLFEHQLYRKADPNSGQGSQ